MIKMHAYDNLIQVENRVLLHLLNSHSSNHEYNIPIALTQTGIAQAVGASRSHISKTIRNSIDRGYLQVCNGRVKHRKKKQKYFLLTDYGKEYAYKIKKRLSNLTVTLEQLDDTSKMIKIDDIIPYLRKERICTEITELDIYNSISNDLTVSIDYLKNNKKMQFYDHSTDAPMIVHFFGREKETALLKKWIDDKEGHNVIFIHGMEESEKRPLLLK
ncbi:MAG: winged helix-turn-helix domain-containing protein [Methanomassiliicoccales archaeon]|nr:MAG: winged helix-turn-helix domain-containing protein [Methanomassiliicoccales archaeon]